MGAAYEQAAKRLNDIRVRLAHNSIFALHVDDISLNPSQYEYRKRSLKFEPLKVDSIIQFSKDVWEANSKLDEIVRRRDPV